MKVIVTGSTGMLGKDVVDVLVKGGLKVFPFSRKKNPVLGQNDVTEIDLTDTKSLTKLLDDITPDIIVHCAADTNLDRCEKDIASARAINVEASKALASYRPDHTRFIYISTDSVYDGQTGTYKEDSATAPLNNYAKTKLEGEHAVQSVNKNSAILRTNIYGFHIPKGKAFFIEGALEKLLKNEQLNGFDNIFFNPVYTRQLANIIKRLITSPISGILNIGSIEQISKYEMLVKTAKTFDLDEKLINRTQAEFSTPRPMNTTLSTAKLKMLLGNVPSIDEGLRELRSDHEKAKPLLMV